MSGNNGLDILRAAVVGALDDNYQGKQAQAVVTVTSVQRNGAGGVETVTGTIDGAGAFTVPMKGREAGVGDQLLVAYPKGSPVGAELAYLRHSSSDNPAAGLLQIDPDLPPPTFAAVPFSTALVATPGSITARATIYLVAVEERFRPSGYVVSFRVDAGLGYGEWGDLRVPHLGGTQECSLGSDFAPGASIDVKLRAEYNWAASASVASETRTFTAALDNATPGNASGLAVGTGTPGTLILQAAGSVDATIFAGWRYEIATSSGGAGLQTSAPLPGEWTPQGLSAGNYYVAVRPVSKSGTLGGRYPGSGYAGPYAVTGAYAPDTTPPPVWGAPSLSIVRNQPATGGEEAVLTVTLPFGYAYPADYQQTIVRFSNTGAGVYFERTIRQGVTSITEVVPFGTTAVTLQGEDTSGNRSAASPGTSASITATGVPGSAPTVTTATVALAIVAQWTAVTSALAYEVQRATSSGGAGATTIATTDTRQWVDTLTTPTIIQPTYWYRVRAVNLLGSGPYSGWVSGTAGLVDAQNLRLNSITANQMAANSIAANSIQAGAITASKLEADLVMATQFRTGPTGAARMEMHGQIAGDANANSLIAVNAAGLVTMKLTGTGLEFRNTGGTAALSSGIDGGGVGYLQSAGGFGIRGDYTTLDLTNSQYMYWGYDQADGSAATRTKLYLTRVRSGGQSYGIGLIGWREDPSAITYAPRVIFGYTTDPLNATNNLPTDRTEISGGSVYSSGNYILGGTLFLSNGGAYGRLRLYAGAGLGFVVGSSIYTDELWSNVSDGNKIAVAGAFVNRYGSNNGGYGETVHRREFRVDNTGAIGGHIDIGRTYGGGYWALGRQGTQDIQWDGTNSRTQCTTDFRIDGTLSKSAGTFEICHPDPMKADTHLLRHSFVESADRGTNIYDYEVETTQPGETVTLDLPDYWRYLNERPRAWVNPIRHFGAAYAEVSDDLTTLEVTCQTPGRYRVLLLGTRKDPAAVASWEGGGGLEPLNTQQEATDVSE